MKKTPNMSQANRVGRAPIINYYIFHHNFLNSEVAEILRLSDLTITLLTVGKLIHYYNGQQQSVSQSVSLLLRIWMSCSFYMYIHIIPTLACAWPWCTCRVQISLSLCSPNWWKLLRKRPSKHWYQNIIVRMPHAHSYVLCSFLKHYSYSILHS